MHLFRRLDVLGERDFRLLFGGHAVSFLGDGMVNVALAFAVIELTGAASDLGLVLAARSVPLVGFLLVGGLVADRLPRRRVMLGADLVRLLSQGTIAALLLADIAHVWSLMALAAVSGTATAFFRPAAKSLVPAVTSQLRLQQANALLGSAQALGFVVGPALAGALVAVVGPGCALAVDAATFAVSAAFIGYLRVPPQARPRRRSSFAADLRDGWDAFRSRTWLWTCVARDAVDNLLFACWNTLGPFVAVRAFGGASTWGLIVATFGVGLLIGGLAALHLEPRRPLVVVTAPALIVALPLGLLALEAPAPLIGLGAFACGAGTMVGLSVWETALQRHIPDTVLSRVIAYDSFTSLAVQPVGFAVWGPIATAIGLGETLWLACALGVVSTLAVLALPSVRRLPAYPTQLA